MNSSSGNLFTTISAVILLAFSLNQAQARLDWTIEQCEQKYGKATIAPKIGSMFPDSSVEATFKFEGMSIRVVWFPSSDKAQAIRYTSDAPKMTTEQLDALLNANSAGYTWKPFFDGQSRVGTAISSAMVDQDMRSGYFERSDGARTGTIMLWAINNVSLKSGWLVAMERRKLEEKQEKQSKIPNF